MLKLLSFCYSVLKHILTISNVIFVPTSHRFLAIIIHTNKCIQLYRPESVSYQSVSHQYQDYVCFDFQGKYVETSVRPSRPNSHSDPPLSPIEEIPWEDTLLLPTRPWPVQAPGSWPGLTAETERPLPAEGPVESVSYKPHAPCIEEDKEEAGHGGVCGEQGDVPDSPAQERGSGCSLTLNGFPKLSSLYGADGDVPNMRSLGFTEGSGSRLSGLLCSGVFFGGAETEGQGTMCAGYSTGGEGDPWRT